MSYTVERKQFHNGKYTTAYGSLPSPDTQLETYLHNRYYEEDFPGELVSVQQTNTLIDTKSPDFEILGIEVLIIWRTHPSEPE